MAYEDVRKFVPLSRIVGDAALDTHADYGSVEREYSRWAVRGLKKLMRETIKSGKRYVLLEVNKHLNVAQLPCDFEEDLFVGYINECKEKIPLDVNPNLAGEPEWVPWDESCDKKCTNCYPKQLCTELQNTEERTIKINGTDYTQTTARVLQPDGSYCVVQTTPFLNMETGQVEMRTTTEVVTSFDVEQCGCIKKTPDNEQRLKDHCGDQWLCCCAPCSNDCYYQGGYQIFSERGIIKVDAGFDMSQVYMEYRGLLPKRNGEYVIPEVAAETLVAWIKYKEIENRKGVTMSERSWRWDRYVTERGNMEKVLTRVKLDTIIRAAIGIPKFSEIP